MRFIKQTLFMLLMIWGLGICYGTQSDYRLIGVKDSKKGHSDPSHLVVKQKQQLEKFRASGNYDIANYYNLTNRQLLDWIAAVPSSVHEGHYFNINNAKGEVLYSSHNIYIVCQEIIYRMQNWNGDTSDAGVNPIAQYFKFLRGSQYVLYRIYGANPPTATWAKDKYRDAVLEVINTSSLYNLNGSTQDQTGRCTLLYQAYSAGTSLMGMQDKFIGIATSKLSYFTPAKISANSNVGRVMTAILTLNYAGFRQVGTSIKNMTMTDQTKAYYCFMDFLSYFNNHASTLQNSNIEYQLTDLCREICRYMSTENSTLYSWIKNYIKSAYQTVSGFTSKKAWAEMCSNINYYKPSELAWYGVPSNWKTTILNSIFTNQKLYASIEAKLFTQDMSTSDLDAIAAMLGRTKNLFHQKTGIASNNPVTGDVNFPVNLYLFKNYSDFKFYSGILFSIYQPAGGMYIEGDPTDATSPYSILYDIDTSASSYGIWNGTHEFTHYLDGRYIKSGTYSDEIQNINVCYTEGLANFIAFTQQEGSYPGSFQASYTWIKNNNINLSYLLSTPRDPWDSDRIYTGAPVAVKFLIDQKPARFNQIKTYLRAGDYAGLENYLINTIGTSEDAAFTNWVNAQ